MDTDIFQTIAAHNCISLSHADALFGFRSQGASLPILVIDHPLFDAKIALQGAQLLTFAPKGEAPWLWLSPLATFKKDNAIRGGIPLCFPWFGPHQKKPSLPKHGFARITTWTLEHIRSYSDALALTFSMKHTGKTNDFLHPFTAQLTLTLSNVIDMDLSFTHLGKQPASYSFAFHSYFNVDDIHTTKVSGLDNLSFFDSAHNKAIKGQKGDIRFSGELDRIYTATTGRQTISNGKIRYQLTAQHAPSCIVWNPGKALSNNMNDVKQHYQKFVCVESGATHTDSILLPPNESHQATLKINTN